MSYGLKKKTFQAVRGLQGLVGHYTKGQKLVAEAVDPKFPWGPETALMDKIADLTTSREECTSILSMVWDTIGDTATKKWKKIYKALLLLEHLLTYGSETCVQQIQDNVYRIRALSNYIYKDKNGNDQGVNVRKRSVIVADLATDEDLKDTRARALDNKSRYKGMSSSGGGYGYSSREGGYNSGSSYSSSTYSSSTARSRPSNTYDSFVEQPPPASLVLGSETTPTAQYQHQAPAPTPAPAMAPAPVAAPQPQPQPQQVFGGWGQPATQPTQTFTQAPPPVQPAPQAVDFWGAPQPVQPAPTAPTQPQPLIDLFGSAPAQPAQPAPAPAQPVVLPPMTSTMQPARQADPFADLFGTPAPAPAPATGVASARPLDRNQAKSPLDSLFDL